MAKQYYSILTEHGTLAFAKAVGNKTPLPITHMAVGDGNGSNTTPNATQTALVHEVYRAEISSISVDPRNNKQAVFELVIPENVGGFHIREMGIFDNQNKLVAVANCPESFKPTLGSGSGKVQVLRMILLVSASDAVTITMNNAIYATQIQLKPKTITANSINRVDDEGHSHAIDEATTSQKGIVQLTNDTGLDSDKLALTAKAGKKLAQYIAEIQLALAGFIKSDKKSSSVTSVSEDTVATSKAVKTAYDLAVNAIPNSKKSNAVDSSSNDTVATSAAVKVAQDNANGRVSRNGDNLNGVMRSKHFGMGGYAAQYTADAPFMVSEINTINRDAYHPFIKGRVRSKGDYGEAFSFGYTTYQPNNPRNVGEFGRGAICLTADSGDSRVWTFEHNGDFIASKDIVDGSGVVLSVLNSLFHNFRNKFTTDHYSGSQSVSQVYRIPLSANKGIKIYATYLTIAAGIGTHRFRLAESLGNFRLGFAVDAGAGMLRHGVVMESDTAAIVHSEVFNSPHGVSVLLIGEYNY